jgi:hypothetical protein
MDNSIYDARWILAPVLWIAAVLLTLGVVSFPRSQ